MLRNVRCVPTFTDSLISVGQLWQDGGIDTVFKDRCCLILPNGLTFPFIKGKGAGLYVWTVAHALHLMRTHGVKRAPAPASPPPRQPIPRYSMLALALWSGELFVRND